MLSYHAVGAVLRCEAHQQVGTRTGVAAAWRYRRRTTRCRGTAPAATGTPYLDVAALDTAPPRVGGVGAPEEFDGEAVPGEIPARAGWLTLVEHLDDEPAVPRVLRHTRRLVLRSVRAFELGC